MERKTDWVSHGLGLGKGPGTVDGVFFGSGIFGRHIERQNNNITDDFPCPILVFNILLVTSVFVILREKFRTFVS